MIATFYLCDALLFGVGCFVLLIFGIWRTRR